MVKDKLIILKHTNLKQIIDYLSKITTVKISELTPIDLLTKDIDNMLLNVLGDFMSGNKTSRKFVVYKCGKSKYDMFYGTQESLLDAFGPRVYREYDVEIINLLRNIDFDEYKNEDGYI